NLGHREARRSRSDRLTFEGDRAHYVSLARSERLQEPPRVAQRMQVFWLRRGEEFLAILEWLETARPAAAHGVHDLVTRDRIHPGRKLLPGVPGMTLKVDR